MVGFGSLDHTSIGTRERSVLRPVPIFCRQGPYRLFTIRVVSLFVRVALIYNVNEYTVDRRDFYRVFFGSTVGETRVVETLAFAVAKSPEPS